MNSMGLRRAVFSVLLAAAMALNWTAAASAAELPAVVDQTIQYGDETLDINATYPEVSGLADAELASQINQIFKDSVETAIREVTEVAKADAESGNLIYPPYSVFSDYKVHRNDGEFLSICMLVYTYEGGAHGGSYYVCVNARNAKEGELLSLGDLFVPGTDYIGVLSRFVTDWIAKDEVLSEVSYFERVYEDQWFYLTDSELVIVFGEYEIAPYAYGMPEVRIPLSELSDLLIPELRD